MPLFNFLKKMKKL